MKQEPVLVLADAVQLCRVDDRPVVLRAARARRRGGRLSLDGHSGQHLLSAGCRHHVPVQPGRHEEFLEDKPFLEPFSLIPALGAVTSQIRFTTFVVKLPIRHPLLLAKQVTSTAVLTGGRLVLGVGTSPWREDYDILGVEWAIRGGGYSRSRSCAAGARVTTSSSTARPSTCRRSRSRRCPRAGPGAHRRSRRRGAAPCRPAGGRLDARRGDPEDSAAGPPQ